TTQLQSRGNRGSKSQRTAEENDALLQDLDAQIPGFGPPHIVEMGIAKGGNIQQEIVEDTYGSESWDESCRGSIVIHIVNSEVFQLITGRETPPTPITPEKYAE